jgi:hypothetical protein
MSRFEGVACFSSDFHEHDMDSEEEAWIHYLRKWKCDNYDEQAIESYMYQHIRLTRLLKDQNRIKDRRAFTQLAYGPVQLPRDVICHREEHRLIRTEADK